MDEGAPVGIQAIVGLLARRQPEALARLQEQYPTERVLLTPGKRLGNEPEPSRPMLEDLARITIALAKMEGLATSEAIRKKIRTSSRLRFGGTVVSALSSGGVVAAATQGSSRAALFSACVAFASAIFILAAQYVEDYAGGKGSLREVADKVGAIVGQTYEAEAEFGLMAALNDFNGLEALIRKLNVATSAIRQAQLTVT